MKRPQATGWAPGNSRKSGVSLAKAPSASCVGLPSPSAARPQREGEGLSGLCQECSCSRAGQGERAACSQRVGGRACVPPAGEGASPLLSHPLPRPSSSWAARGPGGTELFPDAAPAQDQQAGSLPVPRRGKCRERGQLLCASSPSHDHSHEPRQLFEEMSTHSSRAEF